ncbi:FIST N-terminal domain-containing protein [Paracoccus tegillarcae]|uniref:GfdT n=1 Tax=Paracoccus tegillarcae TaxID=1529068 RepID=A0A2K9ER90_9RHOB|nr:FIST N-terminal domain-containing protein [Paracoccus tegillarcae]AUH33286.1 GfdT [Paracoccus tegillarcae]
MQDGAGQPEGPQILLMDGQDADGADQVIRDMAAIEPALVILFGSPREALAPLARALHRALPDCRVAGCSSAGEIGPQGYCHGKILAIGFPRTAFRAEVVVLRDLAHIPVSRWMTQLRETHAHFAGDRDRGLFGLLFSDGLAGKEEVLTAAIEAALPAVPVLGGSAGDGLEFTRTCMIADGEVQSDVAVFVLIESALPVSEVTFAHFSPTATRAVVTAAIPEQRIILELNAEPAAEEYARLTGIPEADLTPTDFARHPLLLHVGRRHHVRAISARTECGGLALMSAIDVGSVLTLGRAEELTHGFAEAMEALPRPPLMVLGFDCILRRLALERAGLEREMSELFARYRIVGFNTYGEQHSAMHVNQTFVGLAILPPAEAP